MVEQLESPEAAIYNPKTFDPLTGIGRLLTRVKGEMMDALDRELAPLDISAAQYVILVTLHGGEIDSTARLCQGVSYDPGAMTRMIDRLERKGLVRRVRCGRDRRKVILELTDAGKAIYPKLVEAAVRTVNRFLRGFTRDEVRGLEQLLRRMLANA
ncbi:MAG TPA: MarR family transcriptional regulator [Casimicrobiaceae bacterium]